MPEQTESPTLLLVARSPQNARLISKLLGGSFCVRIAEDAESAWKHLLEEANLSLVISELALANDEFDLIERIREASSSQLAATPVLLLIGENDEDVNRDRALQAGATDFLNLPFSSAELTTRARLHAKLHAQHSVDPSLEVQQPDAVNLLLQLSQENYFNSRVEQEISFSLRHKRNISLARLKLDNIKGIIAGFDKPTAISLLQEVARIMQESLRREDSLCYLGNAEFIVLFPATNGIGATIGVNRILQEISAQPIKISGKTMPVTLSGAVLSCIAGEGTTPAQIYSSLEKSVQKAVASGGNRILSSKAGGEKPLFSIDRALKLIAAEKTDDLEQHAEDMIKTILPLLAFAENTLELEPFCVKLHQQLSRKDKVG